MTELRFARREVLAATLVIATVAKGAKAQGGKSMYGLIGQMLATVGKRDELIAILEEGTADMPGCLSYVIAKDPTNADAIWITEVWIDKDAHTASLKLPSVQAAITRARPIIAGFPQHFETTPVSGHGLRS